MLRGLGRETKAAVADMDFDSAVSSQRSRRCLLGGVVAAVLVGLSLLLSPGSYSLALTRFFVPWGNYDRAGDLFFEVPQGDRVAARGQSLTLQAIPRSRSGESNLPLKARIEFITGSAETETRDVPFDQTAKARSLIHILSFPRAYASSTRTTRIL